MKNENKNKIKKNFFFPKYTSLVENLRQREEELVQKVEKKTASAARAEMVHLAKITTSSKPESTHGRLIVVANELQIAKAIQI